MGKYLGRIPVGNLYVCMGEYNHDRRKAATSKSNGTTETPV
jgi:hypothetical protein